MALCDCCLTTFSQPEELVIGMPWSRLMIFDHTAGPSGGLLPALLVVDGTKLVASGSNGDGDGDVSGSAALRLTVSAAFALTDGSIPAWTMTSATAYVHLSASVPNGGTSIEVLVVRQLIARETSLGLYVQAFLALNPATQPPSSCGLPEAMGTRSREGRRMLV